MRKNELIKLLSEMDGNPEIMLWNGYVQDYMAVDGLVEGDLVKQTWGHYLEMCRLEECCNRKDWTFQHTEDDIAKLHKCYLKHVNWECNNYVCADDVTQKKYKRKRVVYVAAKTRGKTMHDRLGTVEY